MEYLENVNFEEFSSHLVENTIPTLFQQSLPIKKTPPSQSNAPPIPYLIRKITGSFDTSEQKLFSMYCNRHYLKYYPVSEVVEQFYLTFISMDEKTKYPSKIATRLRELYGGGNNGKNIRAMSEDSATTTNESLSSIPDTNHSDIHCF